MRRTSVSRLALPIALGLVALTAGAWLLFDRARPVASHQISQSRGQTAVLSPTVSAADAGRIEGPEVIVPPPVLPPAARRTGTSETSIRAKSDETKSAPANTAESHPSVSFPAITPHAPKTLADGRSYFGEISLPNGAKIQLDGIVFSDANPVALLNGRVIAPGASIEGMTVARVEPDRVELQGQGVTVFLLVK
jgi:hypothetical protein